jgi:hypothetical protein
MTKCDVAISRQANEWRPRLVICGQQRFVVLRHDVGSTLSGDSTGTGRRVTRSDQSHFDWMFQVGDALRTWATTPLAGFDQSLDLPCDLLSDHRLAYLEYEGDIGGDRGCVTRVLAGQFLLLDQDSDRFAARMTWQDETGQCEASATFYRSLPGDLRRVEESRELLWRLRFSPG